MFQVADILDPEAGVYALKRIKNPKRRKRFESEVAAISLLRHPNIVRLVDHSALGATDDDGGKDFIVMPLAAGGDLSERAQDYKDSLEKVLEVARALASALSAAHALGVVHRDVKPANVLFADEGNLPWLSDFGICLIRDRERATETHEVAGPWAFMAPEVEDGGRLEVMPAVDVYSLGKLIYYMVSGGIVLPRERIDEPRYSAALPKGSQFHLLDLLLRRMICDASVRLKTMAEVETELARIAEWVEMSERSPISEAAARSLEALQRKVIEEKRAVAKHEIARSERDAVAASVLTQLQEFAESELTKTAVAFSTGGVLAAAIAKVSTDELGHVGLNQFSALTGVELAVSEAQTDGPSTIIQLLICRSANFQVSLRMANQPSEPERLTEVVHVIIPRIIKRYKQGTYSGSKPMFFLRDGGVLHPITVARKFVASSTMHRVEPHTRVLAMEIPSSQWPAFAPNLLEFIKSTVEGFLLVLERNRGQSFLI